MLKLYPSADDKQAVEDWGEIYGAVFFDYPYYTLNKLAMKNGIPLYEYLLAKENGRLGTWHSGEEIYCFGNISPIRNSLTVPTET